jgi:DNA-directed RNA polymerase subunit RPC12/RpoP
VRERRAGRFPGLLRRRRSVSGPRLIKVPKGSIRRAATRRMSIRTRPQVKAVRMKGQSKCDICLGVLKEGLPCVLCGCGKQYHNSCAGRVEDCPSCGAALVYARQRPHVVDSEAPTVRSVALSREDKLFLLDERFLLGEMTERTYLRMRDEAARAPETALFCSVCGRRLLDGEACECTAHSQGLQCPECGENLSEEDQFCRRCGVVFSTDFSDDLYQCPECDRIVSGAEQACECGVLLVGEGNMICPSCGAEIPETALQCEICGTSFVEEIAECPACGRRVHEDDFSCECGVIFSDRVAGAECSECGANVELEDDFCPNCGARFSDQPALEGKLERKIRRG